MMATHGITPEPNSPPARDGASSIAALQPAGSLAGLLAQHAALSAVGRSVVELASLPPDDGAALIQALEHLGSQLLEIADALCRRAMAVPVADVVELTLKLQAAWRAMRADIGLAHPDAGPDDGDDVGIHLLWATIQDAGRLTDSSPSAAPVSLTGPASGDDGELVALERRRLTLLKQADLCPPPGVPDAMMAELAGVVRRIAVLPARTATGLAVKQRVLRHELVEVGYPSDQPEHSVCLLLDSIVDTLERVSGEPAPQYP